MISCSLEIWNGSAHTIHIVLPPDEFEAGPRGFGGRTSAGSAKAACHDHPACHVNDDIPDVHTGRDLSAALQSGVEPERVAVRSESVEYGPDRFALRLGDLKVILTPHPEKAHNNVRLPVLPLEVFDLASDPGEKTDLASRRLEEAREGKPWRGALSVSALGFVVTGGLLIGTVASKFLEGGWATLLATFGLALTCGVIRRHYVRTTASLRPSGQWGEARDLMLAMAAVCEPRAAPVAPVEHAEVAVEPAESELHFHATT